MTLSELYALLLTTGLPVVYRGWPIGSVAKPPYICYLSLGTNTVRADGVVYYQWEDVQVQLYTELKSPELESKVEAALSGFSWQKEEIYIDTERCYMILYEIEV